MYFLRNAQGILKAKLSNIIAGVIIDGVDGRWDVRHQQDGVKTIYKISVDGSTIGSVEVFGVLIYLWENDYLIKCE